MVGTTVLRVAHPTQKEVQTDKWVCEDSTTNPNIGDGSNDVGEI